MRGFLVLLVLTLSVVSADKTGDLGSIVNMPVYWVAGHHPGYPVVQEFHQWVACAQHVFPTSGSDYTWYGVATCMDYGHSAAECEKKVNMPAASSAEIGKCVSNTTLSSQLVQEMEQMANKGPGFFPGPYVEGKQAPIPNDDNPHQMVEMICNDYQGTKPKACTMSKEEAIRLAVETSFSF